MPAERVTRKLLNALFLRRCSHKYGWPRRSEAGEYYQVCLDCGAEYGYDWERMCRTDPVEPMVELPARELPRRQTRCSSNRKGWQPRARRLRVDNDELLCRPADVMDWTSGRIENISSSGVLFRADQLLAEGTEVELLLEMPAEITGQPGSDVLCRATVVRVLAAVNASTPARMAASIAAYEFVKSRSAIAV
jgi:hypothetical protein